MTIDITRLRELAEKAPHSPWTQGTSKEGRSCVWTAGAKEPMYGMGADMAWIDCNTDEAAAYIAAANPATMTALLSALESKEAEVQRLERNRDMWKGQCERQAKQLKATRWQPIATAPTDSSEFLAFKQGIGPIVARILDTDHPDCEFDGGVHEAWSHQYVDGVTHWMPLPAPPAAQQEQQQ